MTSQASILPPLPAGASAAAPQTRVVYEQAAPGSNLARVGSDLIRNLTFGSGMLLVGAVLLDAVVPAQLSPATLISNTQAHLWNVFQAGTLGQRTLTAYEIDRAKIDAENYRNMTAPSAAVGGWAIAACKGGRIVTKGMQQNGYYNGAQTSQTITEGLCELGNDIAQSMPVR